MLRSLNGLVDEHHSSVQIRRALAGVSRFPAVKRQGPKASARHPHPVDQQQRPANAPLLQICDFREHGIAGPSRLAVMVASLVALRFRRWQPTGVAAGARAGLPPQTPP